MSIEQISDNILPNNSTLVVYNSKALTEENVLHAYVQTEKELKFQVTRSQLWKLAFPTHSV